MPCTLLLGFFRFFYNPRKESIGMLLLFTKLCLTQARWETCHLSHRNSGCSITVGENRLLEFANLVLMPEGLTGAHFFLPSLPLCSFHTGALLVLTAAENFLVPVSVLFYFYSSNNAKSLTTGNHFWKSFRWVKLSGASCSCLFIIIRKITKSCSVGTELYLSYPRLWLEWIQSRNIFLTALLIYLFSPC